VSFRIAELYTDVTVRDTRLNRGLDRMKGKLAGAGRMLDGLAAKAKMAFAVGIPVAVGLSVRAARDYERGMARVSTMLSGEGMAWMPRYRRELSAMAVEFGESTETLANGLYDLLSAGVAPAMAMRTLRVATEAAKGGFTDTSVAVDGLTSLLNAYQLSANQAGRVTDLMAVTVKSGKTTFAELSAVIGKVAPMANAAGMSIETMLAALATMTRQGMSTSEAAVRLVAILKEMPEAGKHLADVMSNYVGKSLQDVQQDFADVGAAGGVAALAQDVRGLKADIVSMANAGGARMAAFAKQQATSAAEFDRMREGAAALARELGGPLATSLAVAARGTSSFAQRLNLTLQHYARWWHGVSIYDQAWIRNQEARAQAAEGAATRIAAAKQAESADPGRTSTEVDEDALARMTRAQRRLDQMRGTVDVAKARANGGQFEGDRAAAFVTYAQRMAEAIELEDDALAALAERAYHLDLGEIMKREADQVAAAAKRMGDAVGRANEQFAGQQANAKIDLLRAQGHDQQADLAAIDEWERRQGDALNEWVHQRHEAGALLNADENKQFDAQAARIKQIADLRRKKVGAGAAAQAATPAHYGTAGIEQYLGGIQQGVFDKWAKLQAELVNINKQILGNAVQQLALAKKGRAVLGK